MMSIVCPTFVGVSSCPRSSSWRSSRKSMSTLVASRPPIVISLPRTRMSASKAASTSLRSSSFRPMSATIWSAGTRIFTWVGAFAKRAFSGFPPPFVRKGPRQSAARYVRDSTVERHRHPGVGARARTSSRRPGHLPSAEQMEMQMRDRLAGIGADVRDEPPSRFLDLLRVGEMGRSAHDLRQDTGVVLSDLGEGGEVLLRDQQDVRGGLRLDVAERKDRVGLVDDVRGDLPNDD